MILRALGWGTDDQIIELMGEDERLMATIQKGDNAKSREEGLIEIYKRQKPGEPASRGERHQRCSTPCSLTPSAMT